MDLEDLLKQLQPLLMAWLATCTAPLPVLDQQLTDAELPPGSVQFFLEPGSNLLKIKTRYPDGTIKTGSIGLS